MRKQKTLVLAEYNVGDQRTYLVKSLVNSIDYSVGESLDTKAVERLVDGVSWTVKVVSGD